MKRAARACADRATNSGPEGSRAQTRTELSRSLAQLKEARAEAARLKRELAARDKEVASLQRNLNKELQPTEKVVLSAIEQPPDRLQPGARGGADYAVVSTTLPFSSTSTPAFPSSGNI